MSFRVERVQKNDPLYCDYLAVRYQIYCLERGFEDPQQYPEGRESDEYDEHAIHLAAIEESTGRVVGCARIIRHSALGFPLEQHFCLDSPLDYVERDCIGEVSRLAVTKSHCQEFQIVSRLLDHLFLESGKNGITHWYAAMAKGLPVLLRRRKLLFAKAGPDMEFHGIRAPYVLDLERMAGESSHFAYYQRFDQRREIAQLATATA